MLKLINISKTFPSSYSPVLQQINLHIPKGQFCVLIGCNGSGKSTLVRTISGEYQPDVGNILVDHNDVTSATRSNIIATVTQDIAHSTVAEMTLLENMLFSNLRNRATKLVFYNKHRNLIKQQISALNMGLENYLDREIASFSGGQRQMISTLMAIQSQPKILLLDEHTSALDPRAQKKLMDYTAKAIVNYGITSIMVTHKLDDAIKYGDRLIMLHAGQIVFDVAGVDKFALTVPELLVLFHKYEDLTLKSNPEVTGAN